MPPPPPPMLLPLPTTSAKSLLPLFFILVVAFYSIACDAKVEHLDVSSDARRAFHIETFGFEKDGHIDIGLKHYSLHLPLAPDENWSGPNAMFILKRSDVPVQYQVDQADESFCFHSHHFNPSLDAGDVLIPVTVAHSVKGQEVAFEEFRASLTISSPGLYQLWFSNCEGSGSDVTFSLDLTMFNVFGSKRNYLSVGEAPLPSLFLLMFFVFLLGVVAWVQILRKSEAHLVRPIHRLMLFVIIAKALSLLFDSLKYTSINRTGNSHAWGVMFYIFSFVKGTSFFSVLVLIATGWSFMKPFLTQRDRKIIYSILVLQVFINIGIIVEEETSPGYRYWLSWRDALQLLDMLCCLAILMSLIWSIRRLKEISTSHADGKAARNLQRLQRFRKFYLLVTSFVYVTRILVLMLSSLLPFRWFWISALVSESASAVFYALTGHWFRPATQSPYLPLDQVEMDALQVLDEGLPDEDLAHIQIEGDTI